MATEERNNGPIRLGVLISGGGRSLLNLVERIEDGRLNARIEIVISSRATVPGVAKARAAGLRCEVVRRSDFADEATFTEAIAGPLRDAGVELVVMAGFLVLWRFPEEFAGRVINIHPALLPKHGGQGMYGERVHRAVLAAGDAQTGCTVHAVDHEYDHGAVILQRSVPVEPGDTPETLAARVFEQECEALPEGVEKAAALLRSGGRVDSSEK